MATTKGKKRNNRTDSLPMGLKGGLKKGQSKKWPPSAVVVTKVTVLRENDILLGRGRGVHNHPGNVKMRETLCQYRKQYCEAKFGRKQSVVEEAYHQLIQSDVRFLMRIDEEDHWVLVDKDTAMLKIGHYLRSSKKAEHHQPKVPIVNSNRGDEGVRRQNQSDMLGESSSTDILSIFRPSLRNLYYPSILPLGSLSQTLLWQRMQNQYPIAQSGWSSLQIPNVFSRAEFIRPPSRALTPSAVGVIELALRIDILKQLEQEQMMDAMVPY
mmetsp:Transcript_10944/g.26502  ORF Transcript_10944/g.26502 Transcript_10944/m.26502 type:complete len:269 (+) Transcript_10944:184-990(+)